MKNISLILFLAIILCIVSCEKDLTERFEDFDYTAVYFPFQYPVRTLILGDYITDNTNDNNLKFIISARIGGLYKNNSNINIEYKLAPELAQNVITNPNRWDGKDVPSSDSLQILPLEYYTLSSKKEIVIPKGSFYGGIEVQLTDDFLADTNAFKTHYIIPLKIVSSTADSILQGNTTVPDADPRIAGEWSEVPKDFTLFGIKFINQYHGNYLHRGKTIIKNDADSIIETIVYHEKYAVHDELWTLQTKGRDKVTVKGTLKSASGSPGDFKMDLTFNSDGSCEISTANESEFQVLGNGKFIEGGDTWGNKPRNAIHLNYEVIEGNNIHISSDTLVFRDKGVAFQEYQPIVLSE